MVGYIRCRPYGMGDDRGYLLQFSNLRIINCSKGVDSVDLTIPSLGSSSRLITPISGMKEDYILDIDLIDDGTNKAFSIDNIGNQTALNKITTKDQFKFLRDTLILNDLNADYSFIDDFLEVAGVDDEKHGFIKMEGVIQGEDFFSTISVRISFKVGANTFSLF
jgi:hypothetical protein